MRAQVQDLYHFVGADKVPLARSTWSDALNSPQRQDVLERVLPKLYHLVQAQLPDRLADIHSIKRARDVEVITRFKANLLITERNSQPVASLLLNEGISVMSVFDCSPAPSHGVLCVTKHPQGKPTLT